ncbi:MAG: FAD-binding protein [Promethearchaeota archaeon]
MTRESILGKLEEIVGRDFASNRSEDLYIYSQDPGASLPRKADYVVMPGTPEQVQQIVKLANQENIPIVPMGGGLTLSGLILPVKGGIVLDMKRMNTIIEINQLSQYALIEAGVTTGQLLSHLNENYPSLQPPIPDAPPSATIAGNMLIHGSGYLSQRFGGHGAMINGLEVVLPKGEICKLGSCAISDYWFDRGPIPDFIGLFTSAFGTMGVVTKLSVQLFPKPKMRDIVFGLMNDPKDIPNVLLNITSTGYAEDVLLGKQDKPEWMKGYVFVMTYITGDTVEDINRQVKVIKRIYRKSNARFMKAPEKMKNLYLDKPIFSAGAADFRKGGGFEYVGAFMPLEKIPEAYEKGAEIARKYGIAPTIGSRLIGGIHTVVIFLSYSFNRADSTDMELARKALHDTNKLVLELGGIPWKAELEGQKLILEKAHPSYIKLMKMIRKTLDPNGIMQDWKDIVHRCFRCGYCKFTHEFSNYNCPSYKKHLFETYSTGGRLWLIYGLISGEIPWSQGVANVLYACSTCGNCTENCRFEKFNDFLVDIIEAARAEAVLNGFCPEKQKTLLERIENQEMCNPYGEENSNNEDLKKKI